MEISPELLSKLILEAYKQGMEEGKKAPKIEYVPYIPWTWSTASSWYTGTTTNWNGVEIKPTFFTSSCMSQYIITKDLHQLDKSALEGISQ